jgi:hypothetical protein
LTEFATPGFSINEDMPFQKRMRNSYIEGEENVLYSSFEAAPTYRENSNIKNIENYSLNEPKLKATNIGKCLMDIFRDSLVEFHSCTKAS